MKERDSMSEERERPSERRRRGTPAPPRRPRVTSYRLSKFAGRVFNETTESEWRELAAKDWREFMRKRFRLSDAQREAIESIDEEASSSIAATVQELIKTGGAMDIVLPEGRKGGEVTFSGPDGGKGGGGTRALARGRSFSIKILKCTFDANCRNWKCRIIR